MLYHVNDNNFFEHIIKHKRIIWFLFRKGQENYSLSIKPFIDGVDSVNYELSKEMPNVTFFQTYIDESPKIMDYFNLMDQNVWDYKKKMFNPRIISVVNGKKHFDQAGIKCYCLETLLEMTFDIYPELIPVPPSE